MSNNESKRRRKLNDKQLHLLKQIYKFRFVTVNLIQEIQSIKDQSTVNNRLRVLLEQDYLGRYYRPEYRLLRKPASYYLRPKGIAKLKTEAGFSDKVLHAMYKNSSVSEGFVRHSHSVMAVYVHIRGLRGGSCNFFTKNELAEQAYFPKNLPDAWLTASSASTDGSDLFIDCIEKTSQFFVVKKKIASYIAHCESEEWQEETEHDYPTLLLICESPSTEASLHKHVPRMLSGVDMAIYTTSQKAFFADTDFTSEIWTEIGEPEELVSFSSIL